MRAAQKKGFHCLSRLLLCPKGELKLERQGNSWAQVISVHDCVSFLISASEKNKTQNFIHKTNFGFQKNNKRSARNCKDVEHKNFQVSKYPGTDWGNKKKMTKKGSTVKILQVKLCLALFSFFFVYSVIRLVNRNWNDNETHLDPFCGVSGWLLASVGSSKICSRSSFESSKSANWSTDSIFTELSFPTEFPIFNDFSCYFDFKNFHFNFFWFIIL